jgi:hypothetical protein
MRVIDFGDCQFEFLEREVFGLAGYGHFYFILVFQESYE